MVHTSGVHATDIRLLPLLADMHCCKCTCFCDIGTVPWGTSSILLKTTLVAQAWKLYLIKKYMNLLVNEYFLYWDQSSK